MTGLEKSLIAYLIIALCTIPMAYFRGKYDGYMKGKQEMYHEYIKRFTPFWNRWTKQPIIQDLKNEIENRTNNALAKEFD